MVWSKYFILIDADNFIKKHFITKRKPIKPSPPARLSDPLIARCLKCSQDVCGVTGGRGGGCNKQEILRLRQSFCRRLNCLNCGSSLSLGQCRRSRHRQVQPMQVRTPREGALTLHSRLWRGKLIQNFYM